MTRHYPGLGSVSDWLNQISHRARPIRSTTQIWVVHQYGISPVVSQTSFGGEISDSVARRRLFLRLNKAMNIEIERYPSMEENTGYLTSLDIYH